ncbi:MAG: hypothetical protein IKS59_06230, partial [Aeriscardovia sp.]|nr:hypothetical protein [Aeriscardovia sp.]
YTFCRMNHKRLEVLRKDGGKWQRTGCIPSDNLNYHNLKIEEEYKAYFFDTAIDDALKHLTEQLGDDKEKIEQVTKNAEKGKEALKAEEDEKRYSSVVILREADLAFDAVIKAGASLSWHGQELLLAAIDAEEFLTKKLADDVLAGRIIPCAFGQMPEDYTYLADKTNELKAFADDDYEANNNPDRSRCMGPFILYDNWDSVGYGWRATYDDKFWRWESVEHSNVSGFPKSGGDTSEENDSKISYWQLVINRDEDENGIVHPEAF